MADVFISYKREERARVEAIARALQDLGLSVWFDASLEGGQSFHAQINAEARGAKAVLVCWTPAAAHSEWVIGEADIGRTRGVLAPVFLEPTDLPPPFNTLHAFDLMRWSGDQSDAQWLALLDRIGTLVGRTGLRHVALALAAGEPARAVGANAAANASSLVGDGNHPAMQNNSHLSVRAGAAARSSLEWFWQFWAAAVLGPIAHFRAKRTVLAVLTLYANVGLGIAAFSIEPDQPVWMNLAVAWIWGNVFGLSLFVLTSLIPRRFREGFVRGLGFGRKA